MSRPTVLFTIFLFSCALNSGCDRPDRAPTNSTPSQAVLATPSRAAATSPEPAQPAVIDVWSAEQDPAKRMQLLLKPRTETAEVLMLMSPPDIIAIVEKMKSAMQNPAVAAEIYKNEDPRGGARYDPRMGITEQEYERFREAPKYMSLQKIYDTPITIEKQGDSIFKITGYPDVKEITFDTAKLSIDTDWGKMENGRPFLPNDRQHITGRSSGFLWRSSSIGSLLFEEHTLWHVTLGQLEATRKVLLELRVKNNDTRQDQFHYFVRFPGPR